MVIASRTHTGRVRTNNEDQIIVEPSGAPGAESWVVAVADGMGGAEGGEVASRTAADALQRAAVRARDGGDASDRLANLRGVFTQAVADLRTQVAANAALHGMGTTLTVAAIDGTRAAFAHAGDSRLYLFRGGALRQMTTDHTVAQELVAKGDLEPEAARFHAGQHMLTRCLSADADVEPECGAFALDAGDLLVLCSDGLHGLVSGEELTGVLRDAAASRDLERAAEACVELANSHGGTDNVSVVLAGVWQA
jgi:protein phosphatase